MEFQPREILEQVLFHLWPNQILNFCQVNVQLSSICSDEGFWRRYLRVAFGAATIDPNLTSRQIAIWLEEAMQQFWIRQIPLSKSAVQVLIGYASRIQEVVGRWTKLADYFREQRLLGGCDILNSFSNLSRKNLAREFMRLTGREIEILTLNQADIRNGRFDHKHRSLLNPSELQIVGSIYRRVLIPTRYYVPGDTISTTVVDYNPDVWHILYDNSDWTDEGAEMAGYLNDTFRTIGNVKVTQLIFERDH